MDRLLNGRVLGEERGGGRGPHPRRRECSVELRNDVRQRPTHAIEQEQRIQRLPLRDRLHAEQSELEWQFIARHVLDIGVDAIRVGTREAGRLGGAGVDQRELSFGGPRNRQTSHLAVEGQRLPAGDLGQAPTRRHRLQPELKQSVARDHIAEGAIGIIVLRGENVWNATAVVAHLHRRAEGRQDIARVVRQLGASRQRPDAVRRIEKGSDRRSVSHRQCAEREQCDEQRASADQASALDPADFERAQPHAASPACRSIPPNSTLKVDPVPGVLSRVNR